MDYGRAFEIRNGIEDLPDILSTVEGDFDWV